MSYPPQTTGLGIAARVALTESEAQLAIGDTHQIPQPSLVDVAGNAVTPQGGFVFLRYSQNIVIIDDSGLITAIAPGVTEVRVTYRDVRGSIDAPLLISVAPPPMNGVYVAKGEDRAGRTVCSTILPVVKNYPTVVGS